MDSASSVVTTERDCNALGALFSIIVNDLRGGANNWDDLLVKANKFHMQLKATISASTAFLDAFQKIADLATTTRSGTKEIGSALTRLCLRHRSVEAKLKSYTSSMLDSFILPLQDRVEEWKRIIAQLDKDHSKEVKRLKTLRKKQAAADGRANGGLHGGSGGHTTFRIKRNPRSKAKTSSELGRIGSMYDISRFIESMEGGGGVGGSAKEKYYMLEDVERSFLKKALIEERSHYCLFFNYLRPVVEEELSMLQEVTHLEEVLSALIELTLDPYQLPPASESFLSKLISESSRETDYSLYGEGDSPCSTLHRRSRKSSISSINSINSLSTDSFSLQNVKSLSQPNITPEFRPKSIASQDSGFISHDYNVPNIGRLIISNKNKSILENCTGTLPVGPGVSGKTMACSSMSLNGTMNGKATAGRKSIASCRLDCLDGGSLSGSGSEYASTETIHAKQQPPHQSSQPIYANMVDDYHLVAAPGSQSRNGAHRMHTTASDDGSITPTNNTGAFNGANGVDKDTESETLFQRAHSQLLAHSPYQTLGERPIKPARPKSMAPPKPPTRLSSALSACSTLTRPPKATSNGNNSGGGTISKATRIYIMQPDSSSLHDFPPPPPEAYVNYATPDCTTSGVGGKAHADTVNNNTGGTLRPNGGSGAVGTGVSCCDYSLASSHLVLCNDINCLKGLQQQPTQPQQHSHSHQQQQTQPFENHRKSMILSEPPYPSPYHTPGPYPSAHGTLRQSYTFESNCDQPPLPPTPIYSECSGLSGRPGQGRSLYGRPFCEPDRSRSVPPPSRRFHSTVNLSHQ